VFEFLTEVELSPRIDEVDVVFLRETCSVVLEVSVGAWIDDEIMEEAIITILFPIFEV
jgi:hypothetical protein